jgi:nucleobase:cation symporter-1, NCS1 family
LIGLLLSDYWLVRKGKGFHIRNLYRPGNSLYWYIGGFNPRAIAALLMGIAPLLPGLAHSINPSLLVSRGAQAYYTMSWLVGLVVTLITYYLLYLAFPWNTDPNDILDGEEDMEAAGSDGVAEESESKPKDT